MNRVVQLATLTGEDMEINLSKMSAPNLSMMETAIDGVFPLILRWYIYYS